MMDVVAYAIGWSVLVVLIGIAGTWALVLVSRGLRKVFGVADDPDDEDNRVIAFAAYLRKVASGMEAADKRRRG